MPFLSRECRFRQGFTKIIGYFINVAGQLQKSPVVDFNSAGSISFPSQGDAALFQ